MGFIPSPAHGIVHIGPLPLHAYGLMLAIGVLVAAKVAETIGGEFERHNVVLHEPIKDLGDYPIVVRLTKNVTATVNVSVIGEDGTTAADIKARAAGAKAEVQPEAAAEVEAEEPIEPEAADEDEATDEE